MVKKLVVVFVSGFIIYSLMHWLFYGLIQVRNYTKFPEIDHNHGYEMWQYLASKTRYVGSKHYEASYNYIEKYLYNLSLESKRNFTYLKYNWSSHQHFSSIFNCTTIIINIPATNHEFNLTISAHMDSHQAGPGAYDDCLGGVVMLELLRTIVKKPQIFKYNLTFVLLGHEEAAMDGSRNYNEQFNPSGYILNLEGNGPKPPIILSYITENSSSVVKTFSSRFSINSLSNNILQHITHCYHENTTNTIENEVCYDLCFLFFVTTFLYLYIYNFLTIFFRDNCTHFWSCS